MGHRRGASARIDAPALSAASESGRARRTGTFDAGRAGVLDGYVEAYVRRPACGLPTRLEREQGALSLVCRACGARSSAGE